MDSLGRGNNGFDNSRKLMVIDGVVHIEQDDPPRSPIQQVFRASSSKSPLYHIPDNNHYLEYVIVRRNEQSG